MKKFLCASIILSAAFISHAEVFETIITGNGDRYMGYIAEQRANGEITIWADTSLVYLPTSMVDRIVYHDKHADIYLKSHASDDRSGEISTVSVADSIKPASDKTTICDRQYSPSQTKSMIANVEILEDGDIIRYKDCLGGTVEGKTMTNVDEIIRHQRPANQLNGMYDEIVTHTGKTYLGHILSIIPGKYTRIQTTDGSTQNISTSSISILRRKKIDADAPIEQQSMLTDLVYVKGDNILEGIIIEQDYARGTFDIIDKNNVVKRHKLSDLTKTGKIKNGAYTPEYEFVFEPDVVYLNRKAYKFQKCQVSKGVYTLTLDKDQMHKIKQEDKKLVVEYANSGEDRLFLIPIQMRNSKIEINSGSFIDKDILPISSLIDKKGVLTRTYSLRMNVPYALVNFTKQEILVFYLKK